MHPATSNTLVSNWNWTLVSACGCDTTSLLVGPFLFFVMKRRCNTNWFLIEEHAKFYSNLQQVCHLIVVTGTSMWVLKSFFFYFKGKTLTKSEVLNNTQKSNVSNSLVAKSLRVVRNRLSKGFMSEKSHRFIAWF